MVPLRIPKGRTIDMRPTPRRPIPIKAVIGPTVIRPIPTATDAILRIPTGHSGGGGMSSSVSGNNLSKIPPETVTTTNEAVAKAKIVNGFERVSP